MDSVLARCAKFVVFYEHETALLDRESGPAVVIGDFYGDPTAAVIDHHEQWGAIVGCGIIVYRLRKPFDAYRYDQVSDQWSEAYRTPPEIR